MDTDARHAMLRLQNMRPFLRVIFLAALTLVAGGCVKTETDLVARVLHYGHTGLDLSREAKRLCTSTDVDDRTVAAAIVWQYPVSFDRESAVYVFKRLLADKSEVVRANALDSVEMLADLPPEIRVGKISTLRPLVPLVRERTRDSSAAVRKQATDVLERLRHKIEVLAKSK